ncbi:MAG: hypothetical protein ACP5IB_02620 [Thermoplasmata archaeon]
MKIKICPECGSTRIYYLNGMISGEIYRCEDCGYIGSLILEIDERDYEKFLKEIRNNNQHS